MKRKYLRRDTAYINSRLRIPASGLTKRNIGLPDWNRTRSLQSRSLTLYPIELRADIRHGHIDRAILLYYIFTEKSIQNKDKDTVIAVIVGIAYITLVSELVGDVLYIRAFVVIRARELVEGAQIQI